LFSSLPKSKTAAEKAARLSSLEMAVLDMAVTAAFMRPDGHLRLIDARQRIVETRVFELYTIEIECAVLSLVFGPNGRVAVLDFELTCPLLDVPAHTIIV
jgi:hypothetical protein